MLKFSKYSTTVLLFITLLFPGCASTGYSLTEPHYYSNTFDEVVKSIDEVFELERLSKESANMIDDDTYQINFYKVSSREYVSGANSYIIINIVDTSRTSIQIYEARGSGLGRNSHSGNVMRDIYKALDNILSLQPKTVAVQ
ncbi:MAG: hypothetical protein WD016_06645 [Balneolaceae bacterium]